MKLNLKSPLLVAATLVTLAGFGATAQAADYVVDDAHTSIGFRIKHLGYSWLSGRFDKFDGTFSFDEKSPADASVKFAITTASINSNHSARDTHLRSGDFLDAAKFQQATFESTSVKVTGDNTAVINGKLTLRGVTNDVAIDMEYVGGGKDPWGGVRQGFTGTTTLALADYGITFNLGPASTHVELTLNVEGIQQ